ncbi:MAG: IS481 family transposase [Acidisphaera sp.]|nr:IS481 family transposase [Acidisphaera sp.]
MDVHKNARTTCHSRMLMIERLQVGWTVVSVAEALGVTPKTVRKWRNRFAATGAGGLADHSSRPHRSPSRLDGQAEAEIEALRRDRMSGPAIARSLARPLSTIGVVLRRRGLGRLTALDPRPPLIRYERERPGELVHIDIKKLGRIDGIGHRITGDRTGQSNRRAIGRGLGWEYLHVAVDDRSRLAYTQLLPSERKQDATAFLNSSLAWFNSHGVVVERVMTDNGSAYKSKVFAAALKANNVTHKRTRPYTPRTNGKAERFIQSSIREWAYARAFQTSADRQAAMHPWLHNYNTSRPHAALGGKPPIFRLTRDNVLGSDI